MRKLIFLKCILMLQVRLSCFHVMDYFTVSVVVPCMGQYVHFVQVCESSSWLVLFSCCSIVHEYRKFPVRNPGSIDHDHLIVIISSLWIRPQCIVNRTPVITKTTINEYLSDSIVCNFSYCGVDMLSHWPFAMKLVKIGMASKKKKTPLLKNF